MKPADWALLLGLGWLIGILFQLYWTAPIQAREVTVNAPDGSHTHPLDRNQELTVAGPLGNSRLEIRDGAVRFVASPCRHQICVRSGWHSRSGAVAACVPNRISLVLRGGQSEYDGLSY